MSTIESKTAEAILQIKQKVTIGADVYEVAPPSVATLILISEAVAELPSVRLDMENIVTESLYIAKDCRILGDIVAILILGAKNLNTIKTIKEKRFFGLVTRREEIVIDNKVELSKKILEDIPPKELHTMTVELLKSLQVADFFGLTTSLIEINLTRQTREVVTIASGQ